MLHDFNFPVCVPDAQDHQTTSYAKGDLYNWGMGYSEHILDAMYQEIGSGGCIALVLPYVEHHSLKNIICLHFLKIDQRAD